MSILEVKNLRKAYGQVTALKSISLTVKEGEIISILGPSGCGKSTFLQLVAGLQEPSDGEILLNGKQVADSTFSFPPEKRPVNMVFQDYALWPHMNVHENIAYGLKRQKMKRGAREQRVEKMLKLLELEHLAKRLPAQLSGGQQQRVGIARALATQNRLLLMDEPLSNLDVKLRMQMRSELALLLRELMITVLHVTHDTFEAFALADRLLILKDGQIEQLDTPQNVYENPASPWVANLLGFHIELEGERQDANRMLLEDQFIHGSNKNERGQAAGKADQKIIMMLHPDDVELVGEPEELDAQFNYVQGTVKTCAFEGRTWRNQIEVGHHQTLSVSTKEPARIGCRVKVRFPIEKTLFFDKAGVEVLES